MRRVALYLFAGLCFATAIAIPTGLVDASCRFVHRVHHNVVEAVVTPVLAATFVPVAVPVYSAGFTAGYSQPAVADHATQAELKSLREKVAKLEAGQPQILPQQAPPAPVAFKHADLIKRSCVACHDKTTAGKGGGFVMMSGGNLLSLTAEQKLSVINRITLAEGDPKRMPRGGKLTDDEVAEITLGLVQR